ncbi:MAG TPA: chemotaxis protein CheB [Terriglobales bacterium]|nr:chemotaxis protein CheB [Terriglobales bacterium]
MTGLVAGIPDVAAAVAPRPRPLSVVAIGASAGGVAALPVVLTALPPDLAAAVLVVLHLQPDAHSYLAPILARECRLPVQEARDGDVVALGVVYVAPRAVHLTLRNGLVLLTDAPREHFSRPSVDVLFRSVAAACGARAVGVILTGVGGDGAAGLRAIRAGGGRTIVQDPADASHGGMPGAALATGCADQMLPVAEIGAAVVALVGGGAGD